MFYPDVSNSTKSILRKYLKANSSKRIINCYHSYRNDYLDYSYGLSNSSSRNSAKSNLKKAINKYINHNLQALIQPELGGHLISILPAPVPNRTTTVTRSFARSIDPRANESDVPSCLNRYGPICADCNTLWVSACNFVKPSFHTRNNNTITLPTISADLRGWRQPGCGAKL